MSETTSRKRPSGARRMWAEARRHLPLLSPLPTVAILALGVTLSLVAFSAVSRATIAPIEEEFERSAVHLAGAVEHAFARNVQAVGSLGAFYAASEEVTRDEFHAFTANLLAQHEGIQALSWVPRVAAEARQVVEEAARTAYPSFTITERGRGGALVPAARRAELFPIAFIEPYAGNEAALGYDLASESSRRTTLEEARDAGVAVATPRIRLVQDSGRGWGVLVVLPVYRNGAPAHTVAERRTALIGFLTEVIRLGDTMNVVLEDFPANHIDVVLCDADAPPDIATLFARTSIPGFDVDKVCGSLPALSSSRLSSFMVANRHWTLATSRAAATNTAISTWPAWAVLAAGMLVTCMLVAYLQLARRHAEELVNANQTLTREIRERAQAEEQLARVNRELERLSREDATMGISNRRHLDEHLTHEWHRAARNGSPLGLIIADVDHFKLYNDEHGHPAGDDCLRRVALACRDALVRPADLVGRFGGDELAVVLPDTDMAGSVQVAERLLGTIRSLAIEHPQSPTDTIVTASLGVGAVVPSRDISLMAFVRAVDQALYAAKQEGRNRVAVAWLEDPADPV